MDRLRLAVLLTCHNRVASTIACLESLSMQTEIVDVEVEVVLVDAGSLDGTGEAVLKRFPHVTVLTRGPELFWNGGMREAMAHAYSRDPDLYVWLNDDVTLDSDALLVLLDAHRRLLAERQAPCIVVGSTRDPISGVTTYGGVVRPNPRRPLRYRLVEPGERPKQATTMNGNCVLVPKEVVLRIGILAAVYTHGMGDYDYGHRAGRAGCEVWIAPGTVGTCARNAPAARAASLSEHRERATNPTSGLPPAEWYIFARRWAGPLWPVYASSPYIRRFLRWLRRG
jgi:GT2 family glycosyltransferase